MNTTRTAWNRLAAAARRSPAPLPESSPAPFGFATRVAALALSRPPASLYEFFSWRALGMAALIAIVSVAANLGSVLNSLDDDPLAVGDPVAEVLSLT
jgi:hypothetical protein